MRHIISAVAYILALVWGVVMSVVYLFGEYTEGGFVKECWWMYLIGGLLVFAAYSIGGKHHTTNTDWSKYDGHGPGSNFRVVKK